MMSKERNVGASHKILTKVNFNKVKVYYIRGEILHESTVLLGKEKNGSVYMILSEVGDAILDSVQPFLQ